MIIEILLDAVTAWQGKQGNTNEDQRFGRSLLICHMKNGYVLL